MLRWLIWGVRGACPPTNFGFRAGFAPKKAAEKQRLNRQRRRHARRHNKQREHEPRPDETAKHEANTKNAKRQPQNRQAAKDANEGNGRRRQNAATNNGSHQRAKATKNDGTKNPNAKTQANAKKPDGNHAKTKKAKRQPQKTRRKATTTRNATQRTPPTRRKKTASQRNKRAGQNLYNTRRQARRAAPQDKTRGDSRRTTSVFGRRLAARAHGTRPPRDPPKLNQDNHSNYARRERVGGRKPGWLASCDTIKRPARVRVCAKNASELKKATITKRLNRSLWLLV